jgi:nitrogen fixation NifU-like protein
MSIDLRELYQEVILDHSKHPRNFGKCEGADHEAHGNNPLCGDKVTIYLKLDGDTVADVSFEARGCAISVASASMMSEMLKGKPVAEALALFETFRKAVTSRDPLDPEAAEALDGLVALTGVRDFPMRVKCATLPWHTFAAALEGKDEEVRTE